MCQCAVENAETLEDMFKAMPSTETANWCGGVVSGGNLAINHTGKLYPCIRYMDSSLNYKQPEIFIGKVGHGICKTEDEKNNFEKINNITR